MKYCKQKPTRRLLNKQNDDIRYCLLAGSLISGENFVTLGAEEVRDILFFFSKKTNRFSRRQSDANNNIGHPHFVLFRENIVHFFLFSFDRCDIIIVVVIVESLSQQITIDA